MGMGKKNKVGVWWRYGLVFLLLLVYKPVVHFFNQARIGHPLDVNYFWSELSPEKAANLGFYNGRGGKDWKIGEPKTNIWNSGQLRSLPETRLFALELVNRDRTINNLQPLVEDPLLSQAAQNHAQDMIDRQYFDHLSPEGKSPKHRYLAIGGNPVVGVGENIAKGSFKGLGLNYGEVEKMQRGWMYSNGHRANVLEPQYKKFGYGIVTGRNGQIYAVQMFGTK
jgi:hypothetical protein